MGSILGLLGLGGGGGGKKGNTNTSGASQTGYDVNILGSNTLLYVTLGGGFLALLGLIVLLKLRKH
ncbi:MAG: hypothetical protein KGJ60_09585 [Verrucomicrobiota bacterium]|nr:hypothetical protein [Verrucomicrobiota bacterium]